MRRRSFYFCNSREHLEGQESKMTSLPQTVEKVRARIAQYQGKEMNEQDTKTALIDPVLRALGWDVGSLEEVKQEYKRKRQDKPVDYAMLLLGKPMLFVEAKGLGQDLDNPRWPQQIMAYAAVAGVTWIVITNGNEYRIYNACEGVPFEEKLFHSFLLSDGNASAEMTLGMLSKERIRVNDIEVLWKAQLVDRQVRAALEELFGAERDRSLLSLVKKLVKKRGKELASKDVRASLARIRVQFDFPVDHPKSSRPIDANEVSLKDLIGAGLLKSPLNLTMHYKGHDCKAELLLDGGIGFHGKIFPTCSAAAVFAMSEVAGRPMNANGWDRWHYQDQSGNPVPLSVARQEYLKGKPK